IALIRSRDVANIGARKKDQGAQVTRTHLIPETLQPILAQPVKVNTLLPVRPGLAVDTARIPLMWLANETDIHRCVSLHANRCGVPTTRLFLLCVTRRPFQTAITRPRRLRVGQSVQR